MGNVVSNVSNFMVRAAAVAVDGFLAVGEAIGEACKSMRQGMRALLSPEDHANPPITQVLLVRRRGDLIPCFSNVLKSKNEKALKNIRDELSDLGLDHISYAFVKGVEVGMVCYKCENRLNNIDELCCCGDAKERCHHRNCCSYRNNQLALTFY
ncbi:hypothetical protein niasHT_027772 [Heterodera trifolii]|uniref:Uncharacterized protein n=1 Tax=Heterodera trifolii TaxID=157864 RepID=A0ABD2KJP3_9BILA